MVLKQSKAALRFQKGKCHHQVLKRSSSTDQTFKQTLDYNFPDRMKPLITIFRILNPVQPHVKRSATVAVLNGTKPRKSVYLIFTK